CAGRRGRAAVRSGTPQTKGTQCISMMPAPRFLLLGCLSALSALADPAGISASATTLDYWPQWRGPLANGVAPRANPPVHWSETNNIRWKIPLPGKGHSSPIVFGDSVYLLSAVPVGEAQKPVFDGARALTTVCRSLIATSFSPSQSIGAMGRFPG